MKKFLLLFSLFLTIHQVKAQCLFDNTFLMDATPPSCPGTSTINCINGGQYITVSVVAGNDYTFTTCGNTAFDTQITVYDNLGLTVLGYNDDDCGSQSTVNWNATYTGTVNVLVDEYNCQNTGSCTDLAVTCTPPVQSGNGCNTNTTICTPGLAGPFGFSTPGPPVSSCLDFFGPDYAYIILYITQSGPLEMLINGDASTGYLDVSIFDIPAGDDPCTAIQDVNNEISCNYADASGGCNEIGTYFGCSSSVPSPNVNAGDVLMIVVENWSGASTNFTLDLAPSPAAQTGPPNPAITNVGPFCDTDGPVQLDAVDNGGLWTGPGVSPSGMFDPSVAGVGTHTINYAIGSAPCDAYSSTTITVNDCSNPCYFDYISTNTGACETGSVFEVSGDFSYQGNPGTGTVIVEVTNGSGTWTQILNPPFVDGQLYNYSIYADADGSAGTVTIYFSDDIACTINQAITSPASCDCAADIGTFSTNTDGVQAGNNVTLCFGDLLDITANGDYTPPGEATNPPLASGYDPGISWLVYSCPPSVALTPSTTEAIPDDPCILAITSNFNLNEINDQWWIDAYPGVFTDNIVYFVPITMYNITSGTYSYVNTTMPCYELGTPFAVQYLPEILTNTSQDCVAGSVTTTISGGQPEIDGSNFLASNLIPASASFGNTTALNGGTITVTGLIDGDNYSFDIEDANGCPVTITGSFTGIEDPSFTYPTSAYCQSAANPSPTITGIPGGTFSAPPGMVINASTGLINLAASATGTYTVMYTTPDPVCFGTATFDVTINPLPVVDGNDETICIGDNVTLLGLGADTYSWTGGVTNGVAFTPGSTTTYTVTGTISATGCQNTGNATVTVNPLPIINAGLDQTVCEGVSTTLTGSGAGVGGTYSWDNGVNNGISFTQPTGTVTYTVTGTDVNGCINTDQVVITVNGPPVVDAGSDQIVCTGTSVTLSGNGATSYTWDNGISDGNAFIPAVGMLTYTVTGTDTNGCQDTDQVNVTVNPLPIVDAGTDQAVCDGTTVVLAANGANTYLWDNGVTDGVGFIPSVTTTYTVTGTDLNGCVNTDQVVVTVNPNPAPVITGPTEYCTGTFATLSTISAYTTYTWSTGDVTSTSDVTVADNPITVTVTNTFGCTSTSPSFIVTENSVITYNTSVEICQGESTLIHGVSQSVAGTYSQTYTLASGCDSTSNVTLTVHSLPVINAGSDQFVCEGTSVTLNATGAPTISWDNGVINNVAFTPSVGTIIYTATGTDSFGCQNIDQVNVTVNSLPVVNAGIDQTVCEGLMVTLNGAGANTYSWDNMVTDGVAFNSSVGTTTYTVTGTDINGCEDTDQVNITVNSLPVIDAGSPQIVCIGDVVTLAGSGAGTGGSYLWDNGITDNNAFTPSLGTTTYTVTGTDANGCLNTDQVDVVANPLPLVNAGVDQNVCENGQVTVTATGAGVGGSYSWTGTIVNGVPFTPVSTQTYSVTGTDANGCQNTDQVIVTVNPLPNIDAGPDQEVCDGVPVTLSASGAGAGTYNWTGGIVNNTPFNQQPGTQIYTVTGTDANGCQNTDELTVVVNSLPNVFAGEDLIFCGGSQIILTGSGASTYSWNNGVTDGVLFAPSSTATYNVTGTDVNGCQNTDEVIATIESAPMISISADTTQGCAPLTVLFTNESTDPTYNCVWTFSNGDVLTGCNSVETVFENGGYYDVTFSTTSQNGCASSLTYNDYIYVEDVPQASFYTSGSLLTNLDTEVDYTNTSQNASSYIWIFGDGSPLSTEVNPVHNFGEEAPASYITTLIAYSETLGCTDTAILFIKVDEEVIFYVPNAFTPDADAYNEVFQPVFYSGYDPFDYTLLIFNRWGEIVFESHDVDVGWDGTYGVDGEIVQDGTYTWKIEFKTTNSDERMQSIGHVIIMR